MDYVPGELEKVFDTTIDVVNPIHFCTAKNKHLMDELHTKFVGRCYKGSLIIRINKVLKSSSCRINDSNNAGEAVIDVQFAATVREFCRWDIITNVEVRIVTPLVAGHYNVESLGKTEAQVFVVLQPSKGVETLSIGQRIPVRITKADHPVRQAAVVYGALLTCDRAAIVYKVRGSIDVTMAAEMMPLVDRIEHELKLRNSLMADEKILSNISFFETLLYSFKKTSQAASPPCTHAVSAWVSGPEWRGPAPLQSLDAGLTIRSIPELIRGVMESQQSVNIAGLWTRPLCIHRSAPVAAFIENNASNSSIDPKLALDETPRVVMSMYLKNILDYLIAVREMATTYVSPEINDAYIGVWGSMRAAQTLL